MLDWIALVLTPFAMFAAIAMVIGGFRVLDWINWKVFWLVFAAVAIALACLIAVGTWLGWEYWIDWDD